MNAFEQMSREDLLRALEMFARNWLAHDGCWFLAAEERLGMEAAIGLDAHAWAQFAFVEARRIMRAFHIPANGGLEALEQALSLRMYALINPQHVEWSVDRGSFHFVMDICSVQEARRRKGLADFPCRSVGQVEFENFARAVNPAIRVSCLHCPPDAASGEYCAWEFSLAPAADAALK